jgi:hypothetical protein
MSNEALIDWALVNREYKKLKCPKNTYNPCKIPFDRCKWNVILSDRSRGKTTNLLLYGMILNKLYGIEIQYIRTMKDMIAPKNSQDLFRVINDFGYVKKITDGEWEFVTYDRRRWYYARIEGDEIIKSETQICTMLTIDQSEIYKSAYNAPYGDFILYDEFIEKFYTPNEFIYLMDLIKTICRERVRPVIVLAANTIDKNSPYFNELEVNEDIKTMSMGDSKIVETSLGTKIYIEIMEGITSKQKDARTKINRLFYGFNNSKLSSITGVETWAFKTYQHPPEDFRILTNNHYIEFNDRLLQIEICENGSVVFCNVHNGKKLHDDSVIYSLNDHLDQRYHYGLGNTKMDKYIWKKYEKGLFTFQFNEIGDLVDKYYYTVKKGGI